MVDFYFVSPQMMLSCAAAEDCVMEQYTENIAVKLTLIRSSHAVLCVVSSTAAGREARLQVLAVGLWERILSWKYRVIHHFLLEQNSRYIVLNKTLLLYPW